MSVILGKRPLPKGQLLPLESVRAALAKLWLSGTLLLFGVLIIQSFTDHYGNATGRVWRWFLPTVMPITTEVLGVLGYTALDPNRVEKVVRKLFFRVAFCLSLLYLLLVSITILIEPLVETGPLELMNLSNMWLIPIQGLTASAICVVFFRSEPR